VSDCTEWSGYIDPTNGYGRYSHQYAHRLAYEKAHGPIPAGLQVMHSCDNRACVNPDHLSLGTNLDNVRDMESKGRAKRGAAQQAQTHCKNGHEFTPDNTYIKYGWRNCRKCAAETQRRYRERNKS
jgi:hypothetical protein